MQGEEDNDPQWKVLPDKWTAFRISPQLRTAAPTDMLEAIDALKRNPSDDTETHAKACFAYVQNCDNQAVPQELVDQFARLLVDALRNSKAAYDTGRCDGMVSMRRCPASVQCCALKVRGTRSQQLSEGFLIMRQF